MIVMKFGGTSNRDAVAIKNVVGIITTHLPLRPVVVISAVAKATNELEQTARTAAVGKYKEALVILDGLIDRHRDIARALFSHDDQVRPLEELLHACRDDIARLVQGVAILRELTPRTLDAFCSFGERMSSALVAARLQANGIDAVWVDAKEFMITDDNFGCAYPLMDRVSERLATVIQPLVEAGKTPVTQGFIGVTESGMPTTMGRESSDFSASIIGAGMNAELVQIWTDVDGILSADPTVVRDIRQVSEMSFDEAFELAYFGAKVLHPNTMLPLFEKNIPVEVRNSSRSNGAGTRVDAATVHDSAARVKSIAFQKGVTLVTVRPYKRLDQYLFWDGLFSVLSRHGIRSRNSTTSEFCIAFTVAEKVDLTVLKHELEEFGSVEVLAGKGSVTIVGEGVRGAAGLTSRVFGALVQIPVEMISFGASHLNLTLIVAEPRVEEAVRLLHRELFGGVDESATVHVLDD
ncbi:MAG: aspartate kinase [Bacteroidota bacterium]